MDNLKKRYEKDIVESLKKELNLSNSNSVPRLEKIVINAGLGEALVNAQALESMTETLSQISGQKPVVTTSKYAISNFKIKQGDKIGLKVTLRKQKMWDFLERLIYIVLPRVRDFRGISSKAFDGKGNYSLGIREHTIFPEIDPNKVDRIRSLQIIIVTTADDDKIGKLLLEKLGMPFTKQNIDNEMESMKTEADKNKKEDKQ